MKSTPQIHPAGSYFTPEGAITARRGVAETYFLAAPLQFFLFAGKTGAMGYTETEKVLAGHFRGGMTTGLIPGTGVTLTEERFRSPVEFSLSDANTVSEIFSFLFRSREAEERNREFSYYIMMPSASSGKSEGQIANLAGNDCNRAGSGIHQPVMAASDTARLRKKRAHSGEGGSRGAIILLHGLNERGWNKYIQWGAALAEGTGRPVVLFPHAWHMNRSPQTWVDRHIMTPLVAARTSLLPDTRLTTFVNVALSTRMTVSPQRFMLSGYQTVRDLSAFIGMVRSGEITGITGGGPVDIFAYSIGALAAQVMMLAEPSPLPADSRVMLFCGGSTFNMMNGTSKLIMDSRAFEMLLSFYLGWPSGSGSGKRDSFSSLMDDTPEGRAFYAMTSLQRLTAIHGAPFSRWDGRLRAVSLEGDRVIPPGAIREALRGADAEVWDAGYPCTHESPFPVFAGDQAGAVDRTFGRLFENAVRFLS